jgi:F-type H+-transporting ATPase subunit delta
MKNSLAARRYAKSLIDLSQEKNILDQVYNDMVLINGTICKNHDLQLLLNSPVVNTDKKQNILFEVFGETISELSAIFLKLISSKKREPLIQQITSSFIDQYKVLKNIVVAEITSAISLDKKQLDSIIGLINNDNNNTFEVVEKINPNIIGGFKVRVGDQQIDASISKELRELKKAFNDNPYIVEY